MQGARAEMTWKKASVAGEVRRELTQEAGKSRSFRALQAMVRA